MFPCFEFYVTLVVFFFFLSKPFVVGFYTILNKVCTAVQKHILSSPQQSHLSLLAPDWSCSTANVYTCLHTHVTHTCDTHTHTHSKEEAVWLALTDHKWPLHTQLDAFHGATMVLLCSHWSYRWINAYVWNSIRDPAGSPLSTQWAHFHFPARPGLEEVNHSRSQKKAYHPSGGQVSPLCGSHCLWRLWLIPPLQQEAASPRRMLNTIRAIVRPAPSKKWLTLI